MSCANTNINNIKNNNNNSNSENNCFTSMDSMEYELGDIYSAPEIAHNSDIISVVKQLTLKAIKSNTNQSNSSASECLSTDCSSSSDEDLDEFQDIIDACSAKSFFEPIKESQQFLQIQESSVINNNSVLKYKCLKPSLFNPERDIILSRQASSNQDLELPTLQKTTSFVFDRVDENYYKIALMNCALKFNYPEELLLYLQKRQSSSYNMKRITTYSVFEDDSAEYLADEEDETNGLSEEELLQDLYSAPEVL